MRTLGRTPLLAALPAVLVVLAACGGGDGGTAPTSQPSPTQVTVQATTSNVFSPNPATVAPGGKVEFEFGSVAHTVVFSAVAGAPAEIPSSANVTVERTFPTAGTFNYHCTIHPGMSGSVVVATKTSTKGGGSGCDPYYGC